MVKHTKSGVLVLVSLFLAACAGTRVAIAPPLVSLSKVDVTEVDFSKQTFLLSFDVSNPNPFPLPVNYVTYGVELNNERFASGKTAASFTVPANSDGQFAISVDLDLFRTAPKLLYTVRDGTARDLPYELSGKLGVDIPMAPSVPFETRGEIRLHSVFVTRATNRDSDKTP